MTHDTRRHVATMFRTLARAMVSNRVTNALLFNRFTGVLGEYAQAARKRRRYARYRDRYDVAPTAEFDGPHITMYGDGDIELGAESVVGDGSRIQSKSGHAVRVGPHSTLSHNVVLYTQNRVADQDMNLAHSRNGTLDVEGGDVWVGSNCWLGAFTVVTEDTEIGDNSVVGAHSVVSDDLPPYCIAAGAPAKVIRFKHFLRDDAVAVLAEEYRSVLSSDLRMTLSVSGLL